MHSTDYRPNTSILLHFQFMEYFLSLKNPKTTKAMSLEMGQTEPIIKRYATAMVAAKLATVREARRGRYIYALYSPTKSLSEIQPNGEMYAGDNCA